MKHLLIGCAVLALAGIAYANPTKFPAAALVLTAGNQSQQLFALNGCNGYLFISNGLEAANEGGIAAAEPVFVTLVQGDSATAGGGTSTFEISPGVNQYLIAKGAQASWVAATTGHKIGAFCQ